MSAPAPTAGHGANKPTDRIGANAPSCAQAFLPKVGYSETFEHILRIFANYMKVDKNSLNIYQRNVRKAVYHAYNGECFYSGQKINFFEMSIDHVLPQKHGGQNSFNNYALTTKRINSKKSDSIDWNKIKRIQYIISLCFEPKMTRFYLKLQKQKKQREKDFEKNGHSQIVIDDVIDNLLKKKSRISDKQLNTIIFIQNKLALKGKISLDEHLWLIGFEANL